MASLSAGARLGPYEVIGPLGAGGMGEVFKARDTRLDRSVAIKMLPAEFANDAHLRVRFEREAKAISQLTHPNICTLYDVGDGYLVMELLEGETLADRIAKGVLPLDHVIRIGSQIANALDRAHKAGIVHRDLKPSNVMLTKSGAKLLDFGLAKDSETAPVQALTNLRTEQKALTEEGALVGTFQYMAPEQVEGGAVDARTDIFALGAVLYEMATGRPAFQGKSKASLIASILTVEPPPITTVQPASPATLDRLIRTCLAKDPDERLQSAHDVATELQWIAESRAVDKPRRSKREWIAWSIAALLAVLTAATVWTQRGAREEPIVRTSVLPPDKTAFDFAGAGAPPAISPDGRKIVFGAAEPGKPRMLWVRSLDSLTAVPLPETEGGSCPFWSPDGRWIGFFGETTLKKIEVTGGSPVVVCPIADGRGGSWSPDGQTIVFAGRFGPIFRVPAAGGTPVEITKLDDVTTSHRWPEFLPDGRHFVFLATLNGNEDARNAIAAGSLDGTPYKPVIRHADEPHYIDGCLVFVRDGILTAQRFDPKTLTASGDAFPLKEQQIEVYSLFSRSLVTVSAAGTLVYQNGSAHDSQILWLDRNGKEIGKIGDPGPYLSLVLSPDEKFVALSYATTPSNIWMFDLERNVKTRMTFGSGRDINPVFSPDGTKMIYTSVVGPDFQFILRDLTTGREETLLQGKQPGYPAVTSWSSDGQFILYTMPSRATRADIWWMSLADRKPHLYLGTQFIESNARFSPDGKWVVYQSNETASGEIYIAPFPPTGGKWQVSAGGGVVPRWRADGKEIFYAVFNGGKIMAVPVTITQTPQIGRPVELARFNIGQPSPGIFDVSRDGKRIVVNARLGDTNAPPPLVVVQHFDRELRDTIEHRQ